jgi:hypothetical protein
MAGDARTPGGRRPGWAALACGRAGARVVVYSWPACPLAWRTGWRQGCSLAVKPAGLLSSKIVGNDRPPRLSVSIGNVRRENRDGLKA